MTKITYFRLNGNRLTKTTPCQRKKQSCKRKQANSWG